MGSLQKLMERINLFNMLAVRMWQSLENEISTMDEEAYQPPNDADYHRGEEQLVVINQGLRKIYALSKGYQQRMEQFMIDFKWASAEEKLKIWPLGMELMDKTEILQKLFWAGVKDDNDLWHEPRIGIRRGWVLVRVPKGDGGDALNHFLALLGLGPEL